jgi:hypothetical protein
MEVKELRIDTIINAAIGASASKASETRVPPSRGDKTWISDRKNSPSIHVVSVTSVVRDTRWRAQGQEGAQYLARVVFYKSATHYGWHQEICATSATVHEIAAKLQGSEERVGKESAGGVEKTWSQSGTDVHQVCSMSPGPIMFSHVVLVGKMVWQSIGNYTDDLPEGLINYIFQGDYC